MRITIHLTQDVKVHDLKVIYKTFTKIEKQNNVIGSLSTKNLIEPSLK